MTFSSAFSSRTSFRVLLAPLAAAALLPLAACNSNAPPSAAEQSTALGVTVANASITINPNSAAPSAAYFTLNGGSADQILTGVTSPAIERAELHESRMDGAMLSMAAMDRVPVPAGGSVEFRPGGKHVMLFGISDAARSAGRLTLTLAFANGQTMPVELSFPAVGTASAGAAAPTAPADEHSGH
jgi:periplasmic copper chaperone A